MTIYRDRPALDVLVAFAFERYPGAGKIRIHLENAAAEYRDFQHEDASRRDPLLNLSLAGLWTMLKAEQEVWQQTHRDHQVTFA